MSRQKRAYIIFMTIIFFVAIYSHGLAFYDFDRDGVDDDLEKQLAEKFAPVLHKHSLDKQEDLADFHDIWLNHSIMLGIDISGKTLYSGPPADINIGWQYDSNGIGSGGLSHWRIDLNDDVRHKGASVGTRPLYYHVYKEGDYYFVQYWYFFTMNDIREQTNNGAWHEGDWEHVSLKVVNDGYSYVPVAVNFYQHYGGHTIDPSKAWWSTHYGDNYSHLEQGYKDRFVPPCPPGTICKPLVQSLSHLHIWLARNSHASFNRYDDIYDLFVSATLPNRIPYSTDYQDEVDYSCTDLVFRYDKLVNMGEVAQSPKIDGYPYAHGFKWFEHYKHYPAKDSPPLDWLAFMGDMGDYWVSSINVVIPSWCKAALTASPRSPYFPDMYHEWKEFTDSPNGFGNQSGQCFAPLFTSSQIISWQPYTSAVVNVNNKVKFNALRETYKTSSETTNCPTTEKFKGKFSFEAILVNASQDTLSDLIVKVNTLTNGNLLQNVYGGAGGVDAVLIVANKDGYSDGILYPWVPPHTEFVRVPFTICLKEIKPFYFFVDVLGIVR